MHDRWAQSALEAVSPVAPYIAAGAGRLRNRGEGNRQLESDERDTKTSDFAAVGTPELQVELVSCQSVSVDNSLFVRSAQ